MEVSMIDLARLAAYLDGEGYIAIASKDGGKLDHHMYISVGNTDPRLTQWLKSVFGGAIRECKQENRVKRFWVWSVSGHKAADILRECLPYFIMKRDQAEVAISYQELVGSPQRGRLKSNGWRREGVTEEMRQQRTAKMHELKVVRANSAELVRKVA